MFFVLDYFYSQYYRYYSKEFPKELLFMFPQLVSTYFKPTSAAPLLNALTRGLSTSTLRLAGRPAHLVWPKDGPVTAQRPDGESTTKLKPYYSRDYKAAPNSDSRPIILELNRSGFIAQFSDGEEILLTSSTVGTPNPVKMAEAWVESDKSKLTEAQIAQGDLVFLNQL